MIVGRHCAVRTLGGVPAAQEVAARADLADGVHGQGLGRDLDASEDAAVEGDVLVDDDDELERGREAEIEIAHVVVEVGSRGEAEEGELGELHPGLGVHDLRV